MSEKPSAAWYLAPIFLGIVGSAIMWYVLKDEEHPDSPKMVKKGWVIGIILTVISFAWIPLILIPMAVMDLNEQPMHDRMEVIPEPRVIPVPAPTQREPEPLVIDRVVTEPEPIQTQNNCDPSYPAICIPPYPPDLDCGEIGYSDFRVVPPDPHGFDRDRDGTGCESNSQPQQSTQTQPSQTQNNCDSSYPDVCISEYPPDLDCDEISYSNFRVVGSDPHGFDRDQDGIGCEVGSPSEPVESTAESNCDSSYPDVCIPQYPPDLDCGEISHKNFKVLQPDPHGFDRDKDGIGCES